jgi:hypothetical protein
VTGVTFPAFGLGVRLAFSLPALDRSHAASCTPTLESRLVPSAGAGAGVEQYVWGTQFDGQTYAMHRLGDGSHRFVYGDRASFHLSSEGRVLRCAVAEPDDPAWQRLFLDTILWSCALLRGFVLLHASTIAWPRGAVALVSTTGGGKTSLAAELVSRGAALLCDDVLALDRVEGQLAGHPGPPVMNLPGTGATELGRELARFPGERWIAVEHMATEARPLEAICLLERRRGARLSLERRDCTPLDLLPHAFAFRGSMKFAARRFEVLSQLSTEVPVYRLVAGLEVTPHELADLVEARLGAVPSPAVA